MRALRRFGYEVVRQTGSHVRLTTTSGGEHHITVPLHATLKTGTLAAIVAELAVHHRIEREALIRKLFG